MGALYSFLSKILFYDKMDLRLFLFSCDDLFIRYTKANFASHDQRCI